MRDRKANNNNADDAGKNKGVMLKELRHDVSNHLALIGSFLSLCHNIDGGDVFKQCLKNAEGSLRKVAARISNGRH